MHKKIYAVLIAIVILIAIMAVQLIFGQNSIPRQQRVKEDIARYQDQIDSLQKVIEGYQNEIERIKTDSLYKESILRTRYGMTTKDEKAFQLVK
ncbi:MAG: septum formation initiator family protein [Fibrobacter sp.]|jgi:cell division protein FtsB|uniref:FtsB family cell division protein n=1 Tax=uncultured Fibrobacter sp. TaxID=261512 RepID=UPI0015673177|nr:septum formation initiator family protein [uncultured Fibrobacter sp.]MBQ1824449.1 septum formation initiator family protein [Fibrobacter sp.]MBR6316865.1 septum formation initiator family protein [Fibrobacter sp.]